MPSPTTPHYAADVFDRLLARVFSRLGERVIAKGGLILELRLIAK